MQTFLPYRSYVRSARCLDRQRLGKQRVEAMQILNVLRGRSTGWRNHPAVLMWRGHEGSLAEYCVAMCDEWRRRGYTDNIGRRVGRWEFLVESYQRPRWITKEFIDSHRSNLLRKSPEYYGQNKWRVPHDLPYVWPSKEDAP